MQICVAFSWDAWGAPHEVTIVSFGVHGKPRGTLTFDLSQGPGMCLAHLDLLRHEATEGVAVVVDAHTTHERLLRCPGGQDLINALNGWQIETITVTPSRVKAAAHNGQLASQAVALAAVSLIGGHSETKASPGNRAGGSLFDFIQHGDFGQNRDFGHQRDFPQHRRPGGNPGRTLWDHVNAAERKIGNAALSGLVRGAASEWLNAANTSASVGMKSQRPPSWAANVPGEVASFARMVADTVSDTRDQVRAEFTDWPRDTIREEVKNATVKNNPAHRQSMPHDMTNDADSATASENMEPGEPGTDSQKMETAKTSAEKTGPEEAGLEEAGSAAGDSVAGDVEKTKVEGSGAPTSGTPDATSSESPGPSGAKGDTETVGSRHADPGPDSDAGPDLAASAGSDASAGLHSNSDSDERTGQVSADTGSHTAVHSPEESTAASRGATSGGHGSTDASTSANENNAGSKPWPTQNADSTTSQDKGTTSDSGHPQTSDGPHTSGDPLTSTEARDKSTASPQDASRDQDHDTQGVRTGRQAGPSGAPQDDATTTSSKDPHSGQTTGPLGEELGDPLQQAKQIVDEVAQWASPQRITDTFWSLMDGIAEATTATPSQPKSQPQQTPGTTSTSDTQSTSGSNSDMTREPQTGKPSNNHPADKNTADKNIAQNPDGHS